VSIEIVSPAELADRRGEVTPVDVREADAFESVGHVPGARNVPFESVRNPAGGTAGHLPDPEAFAAVLEDAGIASDDDVVAYDDGPGVYAARVLLTAEALGHQGSLFLLEGGYDAWRGVRETETGPAPEPEDDRPAYAATEPGAPIVDKATVEAAREDDDAVLVDTRSRAEFESASIPGAVHLGWEAMLDDGRLRPRAEIEELLAERGIDPDRRIVLYCNTARRLSHTYAVLSHLGYEDVAAYEGSLTEWIREASPEWSPAGLAEQVRTYADLGFDAMVEDLGEGVLDRLKLVGLYHQKQRGYFMLRTKIPAGSLTAEQARTIGAVADEFARAPADHGGAEQNAEFGDAYLDLTTRQDVQMHWIELGDVPEIWDRYEAVGLTTMQACGNSVRNVVSCPAAGLDPGETADCRDVAAAVTERFLGDERYANLPRKLKVSVTGCSENCARAELNDLGLLPARSDGRFGFNVRIGGGLSDGPRMARELDLFVAPEDVVALVEATADLFVDHGSYLDTAVNRLRFLVAEWGVERIREELAERADFAFEPAGEGLTEAYRGDHVGVHEAADGSRYVGLAVPVGRMGGDEFRRVAELSVEYGGGEVRVTPNQNAIVPGIDDADVEAFLAEPVIERYGPETGPFSRGVVACTGKEYCTYGVIETKQRAVRWARELDRWFAEEYDGPADPDAVRVHLSGCSASCAQPQIADVGLRGEELRTIEGSQPAVDVGLGGDLGSGRFVDWVAGSHPTAELTDGVRRVLDAYATEAEPLQGNSSDGDGAASGDAPEREPFSAWVERTPTDRLRRLVTGAADGSNAVAAGSGGTVED
jgi:ferredoxin-nitrite reductase